MNVDTALSGVTAAIRYKLREPEFARVLALLEGYSRPEAAFQLLSQITMDPASAAPVKDLCAGIPSETPGQTERVLLLLAAQLAIAQVPGLRVADSVKVLIAAEFAFFADPPAAWRERFRADDVRYHEMARVATLRRFPAGQFHWEVSGFPRSWVREASDPARVLFHIVARMHGFRPIFEFHLNERRKNRLMLLEREADASYYRAARSMEKQPEVKGLMTASWLYSESTGRVSPRLAWLRASLLGRGARVFDIGPADPESGFLIGSNERRMLYEKGEYRPTHACVLWPRGALIDWAREHPELQEE